MKMNKINYILLSVITVLGANTLRADCIKTVILMRHGEKQSNDAFGLINCQGEQRALQLPAVLTVKYGLPAAIYAANPFVTISEDCTATDGCCFYTRPTSTIYPTAIAYGIPVNTNYGIGNLGGPQSPNLPKIKSCVTPPATPMLILPQAPAPVAVCGEGISNGDIDLARDILQNSSYCGQVVFVAWEHHNIPLVAYGFFTLLGLDGQNKIPVWPYGVCPASTEALGNCTQNDCEQQYNFDTLYEITINQTHPDISINLSNENISPITTCPS